MSALKFKASPAYADASASQQFATNQALSITLPNILSNTRNDVLSTIVLPSDDSVFMAGRDNPSKLAANFPFPKQACCQAAIKPTGLARWSVAVLPSRTEIEAQVR